MTNHLGTPLVREYGCKLCQDKGLPYFHREELEPDLYHDHILFQGRNQGPADRPATPEETRMLAMVERMRCAGAGVYVHTMESR